MSETAVASPITEWPSFVPAAVKELITKLFGLLDDHNPGVGDVLADEVFASDGTAYFGSQVFHGPEQIRRSRDNAWAAVSYRRHAVSNVYAASTDCNDFMFIGNVVMTFRNGNAVEVDFAGRIGVKEPASSQPRISPCQVWADSAPIREAMKGQ